MRLLILGLVAGLWAAPVAGAQPLVFGTGTNAAGNRVTTAGADLHYRLGASAANVVTQNFPPTAFPVATNWIDPNGAGVRSNWISQTTNGANNLAPGSYVFTTRFDLTNYAIGAINLSGRWAVDNSGTMLLNGNLISSASGFTGFTNFSTSNAAFFVPGVNVLTFNVVNAGTSNNPMGLLVDNPTLTGVTKVPEIDPGSALAPLTFLGIVVLLAQSRRRLSCPVG